MADPRRPSTRATILRLMGWAGGGLLVLFIALVFLPWLLTQRPQHNLNAEQELKAKNDVRTTLIQTLAGIAVASGVIVTFHTYRRNQVEQDRNYQQRQDEQDRTYERDLYANAIEQLGHTQAPVRLGALYSLEALAQDRPDRRQMVVDVLCAYLRMPNPPPARPNPGDRVEAGRQKPIAIPPPAHDPEELQVRQTAQRLLASHLRPPPNTSPKDAQRLPASAEQTFWPAISIDLTGATLVEFDFSSGSLVQGHFRRATFEGDAEFTGAAFEGDAEFTEAIFEDVARFIEATFEGATWFGGATYKGATWFGGAIFEGPTWFGDATFEGSVSFGGATYKGAAGFPRATFSGDASFDEATFSGSAGFHRATFKGAAGFHRATFSGAPSFDEATFEGPASFDGATFKGPASFLGVIYKGAAGFHRATFSGTALFGEATFEGDASFGGATFSGAAHFGEATFEESVSFDGAKVLHLDDPDLNRGRSWPSWWIVRRDPVDPTHGELVPISQPTARPARSRFDPSGESSGRDAGSR